MKYLGPPQSGSSANVTASRNTFGQYFRNRRAPVNPRTAKQTQARLILSTLAVAWKMITDAQRAAWRSMAQSFPRTDTLGQSITLSGFQQYISVNAKRQAFGDATVSDPPADPVIEDIGAITLTATGGLLKVGFATAFGTGSLTKVGIFASPPKSAGTSYVSDLRLIEVTGAKPTSPLDITSNYSARFGAPVVGDRVFVSVEAYNAGAVHPGVVASAVQS